MRTEAATIDVYTVTVDKSDVEKAIAAAAREEAHTGSRSAGDLLSIKPDQYGGFVVTFAKAKS